MADITFKLLTNLAATTTDTTNLTPVPTGKAVTVTKFGAADLNLGDSKSSAYLLQWGSGSTFVDVAVIALTGGTFEYQMNEVFLGDGTKFFRIMRQNNSASLKRCPVWLKGFY